MECNHHVVQKGNHSSSELLGKSSIASNIHLGTFQEVAVIVHIHENRVHEQTLLSHMHYIFLSYWPESTIFIFLEWTEIE